MRRGNPDLRGPVDRLGLRRNAMKASAGWYCTVELTRNAHKIVERIEALAPACKAMLVAKPDDLDHTACLWSTRGGESELRLIAPRFHIRCYLLFYSKRVGRLFYQIFDDFQDTLSTATPALESLNGAAAFEQMRAQFAGLHEHPGLTLQVYGEDANPNIRIIVAAHALSRHDPSRAPADAAQSPAK